VAAARRRRSVPPWPDLAGGRSLPTADGAAGARRPADEKAYEATVDVTLHRDHADRVEIVLAHGTRQYVGLAAAR
jgi:hypothetical protein